MCTLLLQQQGCFYDAQRIQTGCRDMNNEKACYPVIQKLFSNIFYSACSYGAKNPKHVLIRLIFFCILGSQ